MRSPPDTVLLDFKKLWAKMKSLFLLSYLAWGCHRNRKIDKESGNRVTELQMEQRCSSVMWKSINHLGLPRWARCDARHPERGGASRRASQGQRQTWRWHAVGVKDGEKSSEQRHGGSFQKRVKARQQLTSRAPRCKRLYWPLILTQWNLCYISDLPSCKKINLVCLNLW